METIYLTEESLVYYDPELAGLWGKFKKIGKKVFKVVKKVAPYAAGAAAIYFGGPAAGRFIGKIGTRVAAGYIAGRSGAQYTGEPTSDVYQGPPAPGPYPYPQPVVYPAPAPMRTLLPPPVFQPQVITPQVLPRYQAAGVLPGGGFAAIPTWGWVAIAGVGAVVLFSVGRK